MTVLIENNQAKILLNEDMMHLIERVIDIAISMEHFPYKYEVSVSLVDNECIAAINREYRGVDSPTDVLSFAMLEDEEVVDVNEDGEAILGDIVISLEKAFEQSREYGHTMDREVAFLTLHGVLHLLGYDHMEENDRKRMRSREEEILKAIGLTR
ncbi:MAG: Metal-dependent hydrolase YbeY, involved in rRNA and/or ribosome maturation and assembly [Firmicutes bacterium]|nr:Metal-dependent hydrolase YbeY, involved in rRNA and/or ribosome maturation and assembly [Bacillota bacterium]MDI6706736.1 rRNA maturation RNase YbeY [Bacillota bacterium]